MSDNTYPSDESLKLIREWPRDNFLGLMDFVRDIWNYPEWGFMITQEIDERVFELHTGGWSGNEEILSALQENTMFWAMSWESSRRGGHYILKVKVNT